jgi:hypothetical protein
MAIVIEITANRSGSKAKAGHAKSSHDAVKSALTAPTVLIPADEIPAYRTLVQSLIDRHHPASHEEQVLVQSLADLEWRLKRIPSLEAGIYATGRRELADLHSEQQDPEIRATLIEAETFMKYQREFSELSLQETRLLRMRRKHLARLRHIQA